MAKPLNPYQGAAPAAMAQMGAGILEAGANIGRTLQGGYESMGKGIAGGIGAVSDAYKQYKDDQAKFDATKKLFKAFSGSLDEETKNSIQDIFNDTSISTREKNAISPAIMQYLGNVQQQKGREQVARIMHPTSQQPRPSSFGEVPTLDRVFNSPVNQPQFQSDGNLSGLPMNPSQGNPEPLMRTVSSSSKMPLTRTNPDTGVPQFWDEINKRYVDELYFDPTNLQIGK